MRFLANQRRFSLFFFYLKNQQSIILPLSTKKYCKSLCSSGENILTIVFAHLSHLQSLHFRKLFLLFEISEGDAIER